MVTGACATGAVSVGASATAIVSTTAVIAAAKLLQKYGLKPKALHQTNISSPETSAKTMLSKDVLRVKDAADMNLLETVRHFTFLLSEKNLLFVRGRKLAKVKKMKQYVEEFSKSIKHGLAAYKDERRQEQTLERSISMDTSGKEDSAKLPASPTSTANAATRMMQEHRLRRENGGNDISVAAPISKAARKKVILKARRCLAWAHDPARPAIRGAANMTNDQVCRRMAK